MFAYFYTGRAHWRLMPSAQIPQVLVEMKAIASQIEFILAELKVRRDARSVALLKFVNGGRCLGLSSKASIRFQ